MSELIAEARVLVTPDTTKFAALLEAQLAGITKAIPPVPVAITPVVTGGGTAGAIAGTEALTASQGELAAAIAALTATLAVQQKELADVAAEEALGAAASKEAAAQARAEAKARAEAAAAAAAQARNLSQLGRGAGATALTFGGLRGATLAATAPFLAGAAAATAFAKSIQTFASFQSTLSVFGATAGATADQIKQVSAASQELGKDLTLPGVSASDAAQAMTELAKAGLSVQDSIDGARGVLQLATAAGIDNATATELAANALNAFGLAGTEAVHVADVLANSANDAQGSIVDVGLALKQSAAVARQAGLSLDQAVAALTLFARNGLSASDAGTSFRTMLIRLINPTKQAQAIINKLGLDLRTSTGAINLDVFQQFADATRNVTQAERDRDLAILFGQDAIRGAAILTREGSAALDAQVTSLDKNGTAAKLATARMVGLTGAAKNLGNELQALGLTIGSLSSGPLTTIVQGLANFVDGVNRASKIIGGFVSPKSFDATTANFTQLANEAAKFEQIIATGNFQGFDPENFIVGLDEISKALEKTGKQLVAQGFLTDFIEQFKRLSPDVKTAMQDNVITPAEQAQLSASAIGKAFLGALPHTAQFFQSFGLGAKSGIEDAVAQIERGGTPLSQAMKGTIEDASAAAKLAADQGGRDTGDAFVKGVSDAIAGAKAQLQAAIKTLPTASSLLGRDIAVAQAQGNQGQELALLREQEKKRQAFLDAVLGRPQTAKNVALAKAAAQNLETTRSAIKSILAQRASTAKSLSKQASDTAKAEASAADQAFLQRQEDARTRKERLVTLAGDTPQLADDIRRQKQLRTLVQQQINALKASTVDEKTKQQALRALRQARDASTDEINRLRISQREQRAQARQDALEQIGANLALRTQIAEARDAGTVAIVKRIDAEIANQKKVVARARKAHKGVLEAILALEQLRQKKRDLLNQQKKDAQDQSSFSGFEFLQRTQGFSANLLGNLIPGFATGGLVGNTSNLQGQITDPGQGEVPFANQLTKPNDRGVRPVQVDTTNALLRQILAAVSGRHTKPPEVAFNQRWSHSTWDSL